MPLSIFSSNPLVADLCAQRRALLRFALRAALFGAIVLLVDAVAGAVLSAGYHRYFYLDKPAQVLLVGHSRIQLGIDDRALEEALGVPVAKFAVNGANTFDRAAMVRFYMNRCPSVRLVVYDVESASFNTQNLASNSYRLFYPLIDDESMAGFIRSQNHSLIAYGMLKAFRLARYDEVTLWLSVRGLLNLRDNLKFGRLDVARLQRDIQQGRTRPATVDAANRKCFEDTLRFVHDRGAKLLLVNMPSVDLLNRSEAGAGDAVAEILKQYASAFPGVTYIDFRARWESDYDCFVDGIHLNAKGQELLSREVSAVARQLVASSSSPILASSAPKPLANAFGK